MTLNCSAFIYINTVFNVPHSIVGLFTMPNILLNNVTHWGDRLWVNPYYYIEKYAIDSLEHFDTMLAATNSSSMDYLKERQELCDYVAHIDDTFAAIGFTKLKLEAFSPSSTRPHVYLHSSGELEILWRWKQQRYALRWVEERPGVNICTRKKYQDIVPVALANLTAARTPGVQKLPAYLW